MKKAIFAVLAFLAFNSVNAQTGKTTTPVADSSKQAMYACPMHPEVVSATADKCPKCGMDLKLPKTYACPMHPEEKAGKKAKCSKCGMDLVEVKKKN
jgi:transcription initiation factor IIE alpha subunit